MKILYLLERPELSGGVKVVFEHAALLTADGAEVYVAGYGPRPEWASTGPTYLDLRHDELPSRLDLAVATYWTTIQRIKEVRATRHAHFCQGIELDFPHLHDQFDNIRRAYCHPLHKLAVSPHLLDRLKHEFGHDGSLTPPPCVVESTASEPVCGLPTVLVQGIFECTWKGVRTALEACRMLREQGHAFRLHRVSLLPQSEEERSLIHADVFHHAITPDAVINEVRNARLCLFASQPAEGFGLPMLEAMAAGIPVIATDIPSVRFMTRGEYPTVPVDDPKRMAAAAARVLTTTAEAQDLSGTGLRLAQRFTAGQIQRDLRSALQMIMEAKG